MKVLSSTLFAIILSTFISTAQVKENHLLTANVESVSKIESIKGILNENQVYLKWTSVGQKEDGLFIIERSTNNVDFETIGFKKGIGSNVKQAIMYCFTDEDINYGKVSYRVKHVTEGNNPAVTYSPVFSLTIGNENAFTDNSFFTDNASHNKMKP
jgi:hypothetical protein